MPILAGLPPVLPVHGRGTGGADLIAGASNMVFDPGRIY